MIWTLIVETASGTRVFGVFFDPVACNMVLDMVWAGVGECVLRVGA